MNHPIVIVTGDFRRTGGMDMANFALASHLARRGVELHLVAHQVADELRDFANVAVHIVPKPAGSYFLGASLLERAGRKWARRTTARGGRVIVNGGNCRWGDINWVHYVNAAYQPTVATGLARQLKGRVERRYYLAAERESLSIARLVIANSERTKRDLIERLGVRDDRVATEYYGIDAEKFGPIVHDERERARCDLGWPEDQPVALFIGALGDRRKGFDTLFAAWRRLGDRPARDARLAVVGAGAEAPIWKARAERDGLGDRMTFLGFSDRVASILAASDLLVHPVRYEAYGLGVHEALCRGLPAIVSARAGVAERFDAALRPLLLPDPESVDQLVERLESWHAERPKWARAAAAFGETLRLRDWDAMAEAIGNRIAASGSESSQRESS